MYRELAEDLARDDEDQLESLFKKMEVERDDEDQQMKKSEKMKRRRPGDSADGLALMTSSMTSSQSADEDCSAGAPNYEVVDPSEVEEGEM
ncbi:hypothetical protein F511_20335 [Dorcoceras hygrometricum]|uniref:Uncharacterized protein n=1 Tax=Dorcoceras hygrometricum TaxID=472368 RepID=A0A2Z7BWX6_9LAMI|nr:hypothetical protein F511_20335 [Dorcoceras hygrometricum]